MLSLLRDWLFDPVAVLFLLSLLLGFSSFRRSRRRSDSRSASSFRRRKNRVAWFVGMSLWVATYLLFSAPFVVNPLLAQLEDQFAGTAACSVGSHVVVLGGGVDSRLKEPTQFEFMSSSTLARAGAASRLIQSEPETTVIVAGGALREISEAEVIAAYLQAMGVEPARIIQEGRSANTRENAVNVARLLDSEQVRGELRLVTSALHMPRALQSFKQVLTKQGVEVCPVAVDFQALKNLPAWSWMPQTTTIVRFDKWLHEVIALQWYRYKGWI